jgi:hypothetical protein
LLSRSTRPTGSTFIPSSGLEHDPEKACPALDAGWKPVFGKDHAPRRS